MTNCSYQFSEKQKLIIIYSDQNFFIRGHYDQCLSSEDFKYSLVKFGLNKLDVGSFVGLCMPKACPDSQIQTLVNSLLKEIHQPLTTNQSHSQLSLMTYLVVALIFLILTIAAWATFAEETSDIVKAFDFKRNLDHFNIRTNEDLNILEGLRSICMAWIVIFHSFSFHFAIRPANMKTIHQTSESPIFLLPQEGIIVVDIFFMISGLLLAFIFLKKRDNSLLAYPTAIIQRIFRLWPAFIFTIIFYGFVFIHISKGPIWSLLNTPISSCSHFWQSILFYGNLLRTGDQICMEWSWYLQADVQIFIVCMLLLYIYNKNRPFAYLLMVFMMIASAIFLFINAEENGFQIYWDETNFIGFTNFIKGPYMKPWSRCSGYFIGLIFGLKYYEYKCRNDQNEGNILNAIKDKFTDSRLRSLCQMIGFLIISAILLLPQFAQKYTFSQQVSSIFIALCRPTLIIGTVLIILPTILGFAQTSFANFLLTSKALLLIARISFCTYLVHYMVMYQYLYSRSYDFYYNLTDVTMTTLGILVISLFFGFCLTMFVEFPFINMQKMMLDSFNRGKDGKDGKEQRNSLLQDKKESNKDPKNAKTVE